MSPVPGWRALRGGAGALLFVFALARPAAAAPFDPQGTDWEGLTQLVTIAQAEAPPDRVFILRRLDLRDLTPEDALLFVHPQTHVDAGEIESFVGAGGRVALLDDYGTGAEILAHFGVRRIPLPANPARRLRSSSALALAERPTQPQSLPDTLRAMREMDPVVTNHATGLEDTGRLLPLLVVRGRGEPDVTLAVAGTFGRGRFLAIGDASIAMNAMLRYPGNRALAVSVVRYLSDETQASSPEGRLYILANDAALTGQFGARPSSPKTVGTTTVTVLDALRQGMPTGGAYFAAVAVGLGIILWASSRAGRTYKASLPRFVRPTPIAAQGGLAGQAATLALGSPLRALTELRRALEEQIAVRVGIERQALRGPLMARVRAKGVLGESDARALEQLLARLSELEQGAHRFRPPWKRLKPSELLGLVERCRGLQAAMDGARHDRVVAP